MPRTFGDGLVHQSHVDIIVDVDYPLPELKTEEPNAVEQSIGKLIAENLVEDGATLQMGRHTYKIAYKICRYSSCNKSPLAYSIWYG